ncbi:hypothetical protein DSUL_50339 [Desulfovibrionales bacterium]
MVDLLALNQKKLSYATMFFWYFTSVLTMAIIFFKLMDTTSN